VYSLDFRRVEELIPVYSLAASALRSIVGAHGTSTGGRRGGTFQSTKKIVSRGPYVFP